ncbi:unnamed protein product [Brassica oleracea var. botrytis]
MERVFGDFHTLIDLKLSNEYPCSHHGYRVKVYMWCNGCTCR